MHRPGSNGRRVNFDFRIGYYQVPVPGEVVWADYGNLYCEASNGATGFAYYSASTACPEDFDGQAVADGVCVDASTCIEESVPNFLDARQESVR